VCASGNHHGLIVSNYGLSEKRRRNGHPGGWARRADLEPLGTITTTDGHALATLPGGMIVAAPRPETPASVEVSDLDVEACGFRMLAPSEIARAMVMHEHADGSAYIVTGTKRDQVKQLGNAVVPPVMKAILERCRETLEQAG
jgi:DNA (cytosine-5)-methyltransferase 1